MGGWGGHQVMGTQFIFHPKDVPPGLFSCHDGIRCGAWRPHYWERARIPARILAHLTLSDYYLDRCLWRSETCVYRRTEELKKKVRRIWNSEKPAGGRRRRKLLRKARREKWVLRHLLWNGRWVSLDMRRTDNCVSSTMNVRCSLILSQTVCVSQRCGVALECLSRTWEIQVQIPPPPWSSSWLSLADSWGHSDDRVWGVWHVTLPPAPWWKGMIKMW